jgi:hypothetical protein
MINRRSIVALFLLLIIGISGIHALELKEGRVKLVLHEGIGRFSLSIIEDIRDNKYVPLLLDQDPRTSLLSILVGNKVSRMGESGGFTLNIAETDTGAQFVWSSNTIEITQHFSFITSIGATLADGVKISLKLKNKSEQDLDVGARYLFDTYLGEDSGTHFKTSVFSSIEKETMVTPTSKDTYWVSTDSAAESAVGLQYMIYGDELTTVDRVVFANWKRLNEAPWEYNVNSTRNFNLLPYSINDSAVCVYYDANTISRGGEREIITILGNYSEAGFSVSQKADSAIASLFEKANLETGDAGDIELAIKTDLITLTDLLNKINQLLESDEESISKSDIAVMEQVIDELKKRKSRYQQQ